MFLHLELFILQHSCSREILFPPSSNATVGTDVVFFSFSHKNTKEKNMTEVVNQIFWSHPGQLVVSGGVGVGGCRVFQL